MLLRAVAVGVIGVGFAIGPPAVGIARVPRLPGAGLVVAAVRIDGEFFALPAPAAFALTFSRWAVGLIRRLWPRRERLAAGDAPFALHLDPCAWG